MSAENPQDKYMKASKKCVMIQDFFSFISLMLAVIQGVTLVIPGKIFLTITGIILIMEYIASYLSAMYFDKGHVIREIGLLDNSFNERRIPNYDSEMYYNNGSVIDGYIKLMANIHENALFTSNISSRMSKPYFILSGIVFVVFFIKLFLCGMDDYSSVLLSFIVSSSFFDRAIKINSLKNATEEVFEKANELCNLYEKKPTEINILLPRILDLILLYENAIFESKIILNEKIFKKLNDSLSIEWNEIRDSYSIYDYKK